jgi:DNA-binding PadR family transcriptional regulator
VDHTQLKALAAKLGVGREALLALAPRNDPFYVGTPRQIAMAEWFAEIWQEKGFTGRGGVHLRRAHYQLLGNAKHDGKQYENNVINFNYLVDASKYARYLGLVDPEDIIDRRNPEPHIFLNRPEDEEEIGFEVYTSEMVLPTISTGLLDRLDEYLESPLLVPRGYDYHPFHQPYHVEVWAEKSTMNDVLAPVCERQSTNLVTGLGYLSITAVVALLRRIEHIGKPARILYVSDMDKAGKNMPVQVGRQCEFWIREYLPDADIRLEPIVLTPEQVEEHGLDRMAITDEETGEEKVELDALEGLVPGELEKIVEENIERFRDQGLRRKFYEAEDEAREALEEALEEDLGDELVELEEIREAARPIVERYQRLLERLARRMERELRDVEAKLEDVRQSSRRWRFISGA